MTGAATLMLRPLAVPAADAGASAAVLAGGPLRFDRVEATLRTSGGAVERTLLEVAELGAWAAARGQAAAAAERLDALVRPRAPLAGMTLDRPRIMGVVNVTPDSFSDGGAFFDPGQAIAHGLTLRGDGADLLDIGGESTRPGALPVPVEEELRRVVPVVRGLAGQGVPVSIDTRRAAVMRAALDAGATMINDITALAGDPGAVAVVRDSGAPAILMHMQGEPRTMQAAPCYRDAALDIADFLAARLEACAEAGIDPTRLVIDPGIGFGKTVEHNLDLLRRVALFHGLGCAVLIGVSRKRFIAALSRDEPPAGRLGGSLAAALAVLDRGVQILRVHDVAGTAQAVSVWAAMHGILAR